MCRTCCVCGYKTNSSSEQGCSEGLRNADYLEELEKFLPLETNAALIYNIAGYTDHREALADSTQLEVYIRRLGRIQEALGDLTQLAYSPQTSEQRCWSLSS